MPEVLFEIGAVSDRETRDALAELLAEQVEWTEHSADTCKLREGATSSEPVIVIGDVVGLLDGWELLERLREQRHTALALLVLAEFPSEQERLSDLVVKSEAMELHFECRARRTTKREPFKEWIAQLSETFDSLIERMSPERIRSASVVDGTLVVKFGDGLSRALRWDDLPFATHVPKLLPDTARVGEDFDTVLINDERGGEFDVDALALRALIDGGAARQIEELKKRSNLALGSKLRALRERAEFTQERLSQASGIPQSSLSKIENGEREPRLATLRKYADGLGVTLNELLEFTSAEV